MVVWILIGIAAVALGVYAFWPRKRGINDGDVWRLKSSAVAQGQNESSRVGPQFGGKI